MIERQRPVVVLWSAEEVASLCSLVINFSPPRYQAVAKGVKEDSLEERAVQVDWLVVLDWKSFYHR